MRLRLSLVAGLLVALAGAPVVTAARASCDHRLPQAGPPVPSPLLVQTSCGTFRLSTTGRITRGRVPDPVPDWAPGAISHPDPRTWVAHPHRRLAVYRDGRLLWRSRLTGGTDDVAVGQGQLAFTAYRRSGHLELWVARVRGLERHVADDEQIVGWTRGGLVTQQGAKIRLRTRDGRFVRVLEYARGAVADPKRRDVVLLSTEGQILRTDGISTRRVADLARFGMAAQPWLMLLPNGLLQVTSANRILFLSPDGHRFASLALRKATKRRPGSGLVGDVLPLPGRDALLLVVQRSSSRRAPAEDTVYVLERGHRVPRPLFSRRERWQTCGSWSTLALRGSSVLFAASEGPLAVLDVTGRRAPIDLSRLGFRLSPQSPTPDDWLRAYWG